MGLMFAPLRRIFDYSGRSRRLEYWLFFVLVIIVAIITGILDVKLGLGGSTTGSTEIGDGSVAASGSFNAGYLTMAWALIVFLAGLALSVRRMHDQDKSGWWILIPLVGPIMVMFIGGTAGPNRFGPDPKGGAGAPDAQAFT
jgi:uncharacterized membrane protein YhaH (DUF805 family)